VAPGARFSSTFSLGRQASAPRGAGFHFASTRPEAIHF